MSFAVLNGKIYYSPERVDEPYDPRADRLLAEAWTPLFDQLREQIEFITWLRFSEGGYQLRIACFADEHVLREFAVPLIRERFTAYFAQNPELCGAAQPLSAQAAILNRKLGLDTDVSALAQPGSVELEISHDLAIGRDHDSLADLHHYYALQTAIARSTLDVIPHTTDLVTRKIFSRIFLDELLHAGFLQSIEISRLLERLRQTWVDYFEFPGEFIQQSDALVAQSLERNWRFHQRPLAERLSLLPEALHAVVQAGLEGLRRYAGPVIKRDQQQELTFSSYAALSALFHLTHNRLSISIAEEAHLCSLLLSLERQRQQQPEQSLQQLLVNQY
ncbi:lantibiotic dehydratase C-terminal domain-containing protein [Herpetosiphon llansteffanensis]|uniref:lantibiotic dehydratase C-terminal domain-containing protein n=1 Tax=Herpetosiphon llansteffanensis TaxID=2094568 RepID=UPI000D7C1AA4|nr:lantibiotic dehydratase C-terminal domain-containing protein [Herpetosiphon llansteffanensis]